MLVVKIYVKFIIIMSYPVHFHQKKKMKNQRKNQNLIIKSHIVNFAKVRLKI